jgi:DNA-binding MarR family transcriptional regulator
VNSNANAVLQELGRLEAAVHDLRHELLSQAGLGEIERRVLDALAGRPLPTAPRELALALLLPASTVGSVLAALETRGNVEIGSCDAGTTCAYVATQAGRCRLAMLVVAERALESRIDDALAESGAVELVRILRRLRRSLPRETGAQRVRRRAREGRAREDTPGPFDRPRARGVVAVGCCGA